MGIGKGHCSKTSCFLLTLLCHFSAPLDFWAPKPDFNFGCKIKKGICPWTPQLSCGEFIGEFYERMKIFGPLSYLKLLVKRLVVKNGEAL